MLVARKNQQYVDFHLMDHLMVGLEAIIALAFMTCIIDLDAYKLHLGDEKVFTEFSSGCYGLTLYI